MLFRLHQKHYRCLLQLLIHDCAALAHCDGTVEVERQFSLLGPYFVALESVKVYEIQLAACTPVTGVAWHFWRVPVGWAHRSAVSREHCVLVGLLIAVY